MSASEKFINVRLTTFSSFLYFFNVLEHIFIFIFILGLGIALIKVAETEADLRIETQIEEREDVLLVRKRVTKPETVKKEMEVEEEDQDPDLTLGPTEGDITEGILALIQETEEDLEEETLEIEDQELLNLEEIEDSLETLEETVEETIEAFLDQCLKAKKVEIDDHSEKTLKTDNPEVGLLVKKAKREELAKEKVFQEVILKQTLKEVKED
jgi:hypothetical protein